ncbi:MFS transporter [Bailinhaonella thermotolerans]|uniref:MFS transporter n=1 Tax=Bailinhaonella thermotolerans TaxID=1070861 RepID=A0A3A4B5U7_9ACTN|nr:MFS transporter [Bailinhaonella thermotolerans]RJL36000.1 MFS transporter [Bailinhaonella thermotolerans]
MTTETLRSGVRLGTRGWLILLTLCGATFMTGLDYSIITVALPEIGRDLGFSSASALQWVATACLLPTAALMPLFARASDMIGRRRLFIAGVVAFAVFSLIAGLAPYPGPLVAARAGQGVAAAMIGPTALALMTAAFPEGPRRTRAMGVNGAVLSLGFVIGTIGGGLITSGLNWRWTMLILFGIGVLVLLGALTVVRETARRSRARLDVPGAILASGGLFALVYGISSAGEAGWGSAPTLATLAAAVVLLGSFLAAEARSAAPLVPLRLLRRTTVKWGMTVGLVTFGMCGGATLLLSVYMQDVLGYSPLQTGLGFLGEGVAALLGGGLAARLISGRGAVAVIVTGLTAQAAGTAAMVFLPAEGGLALLLATSATMGFGHVLTVVAVITTITSGLDESDQGVAGGLAQMPTFVGAVGVAGLMAIVAARAEALAPVTTGTAATLGGLHAAFLAAGAVALLGAAAGGVLLRGSDAGRTAGQATGRPSRQPTARPAGRSTAQPAGQSSGRPAGHSPAP